MPIAVMMTGTISGEMSRPTTTGFSLKSTRTRPSAASVPSGVAIAVVAIPTTTLFRSEGSHRGEVKKSSYQRSEKPSNGYVRNVPLLNDNGTTATIGTTRKMKTSAQKPKYPKRSARCSGDGYGGKNTSAPLQAARSGQHRINAVKHQRRGQQHKAQGRSHAPVKGLVRVKGNEIADQLIVGTAHERRRDVVTDGEDENENAAGGDSRQCLRKIDSAERRKGRGTQRQRRSNPESRYTFHDTVQWQHHERQQHVRHGDINANPIMDELHWI